MKNLKTKVLMFCALSILVGRSAGASSLSIEMFNVNIEACYQNTFVQQQQGNSLHELLLPCTRIINDERLTTRYNEAIALYNRGLIRKSFGQIELAQKDLERSVKLYSDNQFAHIVLAELRKPSVDSSALYSANLDIQQSAEPNDK